MSQGGLAEVAGVFVDTTFSALTINAGFLKIETARYKLVRSDLDVTIVAYTVHSMPLDIFHLFNIIKTRSLAMPLDIDAHVAAFCQIRVCMSRSSHPIRIPTPDILTSCLVVNHAARCPPHRAKARRSPLLG